MSPLSFPAAQIPLIERPHAEPLYFAHIYLSGETLYFSDRNFKFNGHDYEAYLLDIPETVHSIEEMGGYLNINASLTFWNKPFRSYGKLIDFFIANPLTRREMDLFVMYLDKGEIPGSDVSTKLHRLGFGEPRVIETDIFTISLSSILHLIDHKKVFIQINRTNWPKAGPDSIGKFENLIYGSIRDIPCHCVDTGAYSTLASNLTETDTSGIYVSRISEPIAFPSSGTVQIGDEKITYTSIDVGQNKLGGTITRGAYSTKAAFHKAGEVVWVIQATYKYLAAGQIMKAISAVYVESTRLPGTDYSISLNDSGKSTITFTQKALAKHTHGQKTIYEMYGTSATHQDIEGTITWFGESVYMIDSNPETEIHWGYSGTIPEFKTGDFIVNFPAYTGDPPDNVYVCAIMDSEFTGQWGEYWRLQAPEIVNIGQTGGVTTIKIKLATATVPTQVKYRGHTNSVGTGGYCRFNIYECWLEVERFSVTPSGVARQVLNPLVTCDGDGFQDDGSGTYTGTPNALIENSSDQRRHFLVNRLGRSMSEIGDSFDTARTTYANRIAGGYKFAIILSYLGQTPEEILRKLDEQSRSQLKEDGGKFELHFHGDAEPSSVMTIDKTIYTEDPKFSQTSMTEIKNVIRAVFDYDYSGLLDAHKFGGYLQQKEISDSGSITKYGELPEEMAFAAIRVLAMAEDVANWWLLQKKDIVPLVSLACNRMVRKLQRNDYFTLNDCPVADWEGLKWKILEIRETPDYQEFRIQAIQWVAS